MALTKKDENKVAARVFSSLSFLVAAVLVVIGVAAYKAGSSAVSEVNEGLVKQKIYFPPEGSGYADVEAYAGKQVDDGDKAKKYADGVLAPQLEQVGGGKTLFEVSAALAADPQNAALAAQQGAMFQLETSKTLLLADGYGAWAQAKMIQAMGTAALVAGAVLLLVGGLQYVRYRR